MAWPKGLPKKKKVVPMIETVVEPGQISNIVREIQQEVVKETFPAARKGCRNCGHDKSMHYQGAEDQCNTQDCPCLRFLR